MHSGKMGLIRIQYLIQSRREAAMRGGQMQVYLCHIMYMRNMVTRSYLQLPIPRCRRIWTICKRKVISPVDRSVRKQPLGTGWGQRRQMRYYYPHSGTVQMLIAWKRRRQFCRSRRMLESIKSSIRRSKIAYTGLMRLQSDWSGQRRKTFPRQSFVCCCNMISCRKMTGKRRSRCFLHL